MVKNVILITFFAVFVAAPVFAQPTIKSIDGLIIDGKAISISGEEFGLNGMAIQWLGDNIETGIANSEINLPANWDSDQTSLNRQKPIYSTTKAHSGTKSIKSYFPQTSQYTSGFWYKNNGPIAYTYITWWVYIENLSCNGDCAGNSQWKIFRLTPGLAGGIYADQENSWYIPQQVKAPTATFVGGNNMFMNFCLDGVASYDSNCFGGEATGAGIYRDNGIVENKWHRVEIIAKESSAGSKDGTIIVGFLDGKNTLRYYVDYIGNTRTRTDETPRWLYAVWENYCGNGLDVADIYQDDIFVQTGSQARVEIGNASTWSACTHREIQIPFEWSDTSIKLKLNKGSFGSEKLYMFVVDHLGNVNAAGREIRFDSTGIGSTTLRIE